MGWGIRRTILSERLERATEFDDKCTQSFTLLERAVCSTFLADMLLKLFPKCNININRVVVLRCVWTNLRTELFTAYRRQTFNYSVALFIDNYGDIND